MAKARPVDLAKYPTIYLPPRPDPEKVRRGIIEIINMVNMMEEKEKQHESNHNIRSQMLY